MFTLNLSTPKPTTTWSICYNGNPNKGEVPKMLIDSKKNIQVLIDEDKQQIILIEGK